MRIDFNNRAETCETSFQVHEKHRENGKCRHHEKLYCRKSHIVHMWAVFPDDENVCRKSECAQKQNGVRNLNRKIALDAEQVKPNDCDGDAKPNFSRNLLTEKQAQNWDENDVTGGEESRFAGGTAQVKPGLLQVHRKEKRKPAEKASFPELATVFLVLGASRAFVEFVQYFRKPEEDSRGDEISHAHECERTDVVPFDLCDKGGSPKECRQNQ